MFGVKYCVEGTFPDLTALRLQPVLVLPVIGQFDGRFTGAPAEDKPTDIQWLHKHPVVSKLGTLGKNESRFTGGDAILMKYDRKPSVNQSDPYQKCANE